MIDLVDQKVDQVHIDKRKPVSMAKKLSEFGKRFEYHLLESGYSQSELATELRVVPSTITHWKTGKNEISEVLLTRACDVMGLHGRQRAELFELAGFAIASLNVVQPVGQSNADVLPQADEVSARQLPLEPGQIPRSASELFVGREREFTKILDNLYPGRMVTILGPGGMGKTELAIKVAEALCFDEKFSARFSHGVIFYSFYGEGRDKPEKALELIVESYGRKPWRALKASAMDVLAGRQTLLILDGTECTDDLRTVLDVVGRKCGVLITTQRRTDVQGASPCIDLGPLSIDQAMSILKAYMGPNAEKVAIEHIYELVGGLTLAFDLIGRHLKHESTEEGISDYLTWLEAQHLEALAVEPGKHRRDSVSILIERSLSYVNDAARMILSVFGILAFGKVSYSVLAKAFAGVAIDIRRPLEQLVDYGMLVRRDRIYELHHRLIHTYIKEHLYVPDQTIANLADHYVQFSDEQSRLGQAGFARLSAELAHIVAVIETCAANKQWEVVPELARAIDDFLNLQGYWFDRINIQKTALAVARSRGKRGDEGTHRGNLGNTYNSLGQSQKAIEYNMEALAISRETGDLHSQGVNLCHLGSAYLSRRKIRESIEHYQQALNIAKAIGDSQGEGNALGGLGIAYESQGKVYEVIELYEQALAIAKRTGDRRAEVIHLGNLSNTYTVQEQYGKAIVYYEEVLAIAREIGDRRDEGAALGNLGSAYDCQGYHLRAIEYHEKALKISQGIRDRRGDGINLSNLGSAYLSLGEYDKARDYYEQALAVALEIGDRHDEGNRLRALGRAYAMLGESTKAITLCKQSRDIADAEGDKAGEGEALNYLGYVYYVAKDYERPVQLLQEAILILGDIGYKQPLSHALLDLTEIYLALGHVDDAKRCCIKALTISQEIEDKHREARALQYLGTVLEKQGQADEARESWLSAMSLFREIDLPYTK